MQLLNHAQIASKVTRLAMEILERNTEEHELYILGINNRGMELAQRLVAGLRTISSAPFHLWHLRINPASPLDPGPVLEGDARELVGKAVLVVDDVANTGRTLFYALRPLQAILPKKIEVAVLVDRRHKSWPVYVTYRGMDLSTTLGDNVLVSFDGPEGDAAVLE
ncbi:phosphoribosyltransferase family protein [Neolewinella lacunae]|uniref:Phosphoribosyltransferase n=1 Tax=Neolewinella lacunae TaxID=1517758 RepID=A0A923PLW5_9BACT|nr:phosphoribosyltransferase family protein [Neolewinella lacunae]MBC6996482.1 phosphoribosyltransferase [Neolewinella lacunae]MDN3636635.1 phosphoribosyltransferase family protein [Neolewinella lacunae]